MDKQWKVQRWVNVLMTLALVLLIFGQWQTNARLDAPEVVPMAIDFTGAGSKIDFGSVSAVRSLVNKSICAWINADSFGATGDHIFSVGVGGGAADEFYSLYAKNDNKLYFDTWFNTPVQPLWSSAAGLSTGSWIHVCVTYNNSNTANDPVFYISGALSATTEITAPTGVYVTGSGGVEQISVTAASADFDGKVTDLRIYNRILSAVEALAIYEARGCDNIINGLVFKPMMFGAAGLQSFDGATLAAANKIIDPYSGASGTPAGSPVGVGEKYLVVCP